MAFECIFCGIINKEIPCNVIKETDEIIVIKDINPKAFIHYLIIPKKHIQDVQSFSDQDTDLAGKLFLVARDLSATLPNSPDFRLIINSGKQAGQHVFHLHLHFLAGRQLDEV